MEEQDPQQKTPDPASSFHISSGGQDPSEKPPTPDQFDWGKAIRAPKTETPDPIGDIGKGKRLTPEEIDKALAMPDVQAPKGTTPQAFPNVKVDMSKAIKAPTGRPPAPGPAVTPQQAAAGPPKAGPPQNLPFIPLTTQPGAAERQAQASQATIDSMKRPSWADPNKIAQDPSWYGRTLRYAGGDFIGSGKAMGGFMVGGAKLVHDLASALDPIEGYHRPFGDPQLQVGRDIFDIGKSVFDVSKGAWTMLQDLAVATTQPGQAGAIASKYADPEKFGKDITNTAFTVDGGLELAKALKLQNIKPSQVINSLNNARVGTVNALMHQDAVGKAYVHKHGVEVAKEIVKTEDAAKEHVREHTTNLTSKIGNKPVEADTTAQRVIAESKKTILTEPPGKMAAKKGPRSQIPSAVPSPLDDLLVYINSVKPGTWTWETVKQFRTEVGRAMSRASGPTLKVLTDIYYNDLTPKLANMAKKYKLEASWKAYNDLEMKVIKSFPILEKARAILDNNGEGSAMANAIKDPAVLHEFLESLSDFGIDRDMISKYSAKANKVLRESSEFNKSMFRYIYRWGIPALGSIPAAMIGKEMAGWLGGLALGSTAGYSINYLQHAIRAMGMEPHLLDMILDERRWHKVDLPPGEGFEEEPPAPTPPPVPGTPTPGVEPPGTTPTPTPGTPTPTPVPGAATPTPEAEAAAKAAETAEEPKPKPKGRPKKPKEATPAKPTADYKGPERRAEPRTITQDIWAKNQIDYAKEQLEKTTDENEKNILRRRIEELEKDPTLAGGGEQMGRDIRAARGEKGGFSVEQVTKSIRKDPEQARIFDAADQKTKDSMLVKEKQRMIAAGEQPVTIVPEGQEGREPGKKTGTTRQTPQVRRSRKAAANAAKRAAEGATAAGGGGLEVTGGGQGEAAIQAKAAEEARAEAARMQQSSQQPVNVKDMGIPEKEEWLRENQPNLAKSYDIIRKTGRIRGKPLTGEQMLQVLDDLVVRGMDEASAKRQLKAEALIKEQEGRPLSPEEQKIAKEQGADVPKPKGKKAPKPKAPKEEP